MQRFIIQQGRFQKELLLSMIAILELYDLYTKGHSEKVAYLSALIAEKLHLPSHEINAIYWAGLVHDIGKLLVPTQVLNKESKLTADEYEMIKMHPVWGAKVLQTSDSLRPVSRYVLFHHERWDGKGYPDEISGIEIPLASRIISVADAFDAMTSERSYRKPFSIDEAKEEMVRNSGTQFDPSIIEVFLTLDREELDKTDE
jgi:HD-GYP domain-containing protein (c-di-GMP phosphodiesterase class II)